MAEAEAVPEEKIRPVRVAEILNRHREMEVAAVRRHLQMRRSRSRAERIRPFRVADLNRHLRMHDGSQNTAAISEFTERK